MELRKIQKSDYSYLKSLYTQSFSANESASFHLLRKSSEQGKAEFLVICDEEKIIGMLLFL